MKIMIFHYHIYFPFPILAPNFNQFVLTYFARLGRIVQNTEQKHNGNLKDTGQTEIQTES